MGNPYTKGVTCVDDVRAIVVYTKYRQLGQFMMGKCKIAGIITSLSGAYGGDGVFCRIITKDQWELGTPITQELYDAWNKGGGHNDAGSEAPLMKKFGLELLKKRKRVRKYVYDYYIVEFEQSFVKFLKPESLLDYAIRQAKERADVYVIPSKWQATKLTNTTYKVHRKRFKQETPDIFETGDE
jgi:hypothetical protein